MSTRTARIASLPARETELRRDLAACFRWAARLNLHEGIANHFSAALDDEGAQFLLNPYGRHWSKLRASDLLLLDAHQAPKDQGGRVDPTAWAIHGALHRKVPQARCVLHLHSKYATALACLKDPRLPPIDQNSMRFYDRVAIDQGFDGMGLGDEAERLAGALGDKSVLLLGSHGVLTAAGSVAQAFDDILYFERACETYLTALATGRELNVASHEVAEKTARQWADYPDFAAKHLAAIREVLDSEEPDYRD